ncbi:family 16 glycosylhydrolase [Aureimonas sp. AU20]|uniref:family 16 glycosylhydrolase n=1 Tax=Aureimonas sp. AU20 TaxID=1349819 RepID=UPI00071F312A|nr:family 16 glycosylhydrolase [Aureimonas sp. AU20]ALN72223.1 hypothetical protein M673_05815 [Aureimonas sp. AU20]
MTQSTQANGTDQSKPAAIATQAEIAAAMAGFAQSAAAESSARPEVWLYADTAGSSLTGTSRRDEIRGGANTVLSGGAGDDTYIAYNQTTRIFELAGQGIDTVKTWASSFTLDNTQSIENLTLAGTAHSTGTGNDLDNVLTGNSGNNTLNGGRGNDILVGGGGRDTFVFQRGGGQDVVRDFAAKGASADTLQIEGTGFADFAALKGRIVQHGADTLILLEAGDAVLLKGVAAADLDASNFRFSFVGTAGADTIQGGSGDDLLTGGAGADTFVVGKGGGNDAITDFSARGGDVLKLVDTALSDFAGFKASALQVGADLSVDLGGGQVLTLANVSLASLTSANLQFAKSAPTPSTPPPTPAVETSVPATDSQQGVGATPAPSPSDAPGALTGKLLLASAAPNKWLTAGTANAALEGSGGNDQFSAQAANVTFKGGAGDDTYIVNGTTRIVELAGQGIDTVQTWFSYRLPGDQSIENLTLMGTAAIDGTGNDLDNILTGNDAANVLDGGQGADTLTGKGGSDTFVVTKGTGTKTITDFQTTGAQADLLKIDGAAFGSFAALSKRMVQVGADLHIDLGGHEGVILKNVSMSSLTAAHVRLLNVTDTIVGTSGVDTLDGGDGNDTLTGGAGRDAFVIAKGNGSDTITDFETGTKGDILDLKGFAFESFEAFRASASQVGADTVIALGNGETLTLKNVAPAKLVAENVLFENALPVSGGSSTTFSGTLANNSLTGTAGNDYMIAYAKHVTLAGGLGDDTYVASDTTAHIVEKAGGGIDTVLSWNDIGFALPKGQSVENLTLMGKANSTAIGNELNNLVTGNEGNNTLNGGGGNDVLVGKGGADLFVVARGQGSDVIADFSSTEGDRIRLDGASFKSFAELKGAIQQVGTNSFIALGDGQTLTLQNTLATSLSAKDFVFDLDRSAMVQTFRDDFNSFSRFDGTSGTWLTKYEWGGLNAYTLSSNKEGQIYVDDTFRGLPGKEAAAPLGLNPFSVANGELTITAQAIDPAKQAAAGGYAYTSGLITSEAVFAQTYGHFEMKATLPQGSGVWPAFWLLPVNNSWPPELDVMEVFGDQPGAVHFDAHSASDGMNKGGYGLLDDLSGSHTYGVTWTPYTLTYFVDGHEMMTVDTPSDMNSAMYMLANIAVGGLSGTPAKDLVAQMKIDSITAYQLNDYTLAHYTLKTSATPTTTLSGTSAAESLSGTAGADLLDGGAGADTLTGGAGDDTYLVRNAATRIVELGGGGIDTVRSEVSYTLPGFVENLTLTGSANIAGTGNGQSNIITGNSGDNVLAGLGGNDILTGGAGRDTFVFGKDSGSDIITDFEAGPGMGDVVRLDASPFATFADVKGAMSQVGSDVYLALSPYDTLVFRNHKIADFAADDFKLPAQPPVSAGYSTNVIGTAGADRLVGSGSNNLLDGKGGDDILIGGRGDDTYRAYATGKLTIVEKAGEGIDTVETYGNFTLPANVENLTAMSWNLTLTGNGLSNRITGHGGAEVLNGKGGDDWLTGGGGNDTFVFEKGSGFDTITDFHAAGTGTEHDTIRLVGFGAGATLTHEGDVWTVHHSTGTDSFRTLGVESLDSSDVVWA